MGINQDKAKAAAIREKFQRQAAAYQQIAQNTQPQLSQRDQAYLEAKAAQLKLDKVSIVEKAMEAQQRREQERLGKEDQIRKLRESASMLGAKRKDEEAAAKLKAQQQEQKSKSTGGSGGGAQPELPGGIDFSEITPTQSISTNRPSVGDPRAPDLQSRLASGQSTVGSNGFPQPGSPMQGGGGGSLGPPSPGSPITNTVTRQGQQAVTSSGMTRMIPTQETVTEQQDPRLIQREDMKWMQALKQRDVENTRADRQLYLEGKIAEARIGSEQTKKYADLTSAITAVAPEYAPAYMRALVDGDYGAQRRYEKLAAETGAQARQLGFDAERAQIDYYKARAAAAGASAEVDAAELEKLGGFWRYIGRNAPPDRPTVNSSVNRLRLIHQAGMTDETRQLIGVDQDNLWGAAGVTYLVPEAGGWGAGEVFSVPNTDMANDFLTLMNIPNPKYSAEEKDRFVVTEQHKRLAKATLEKYGVVVQIPTYAEALGIPNPTTELLKQQDWSHGDPGVNTHNMLPSNSMLVLRNYELAKVMAEQYREKGVLPEYYTPPEDPEAEVKPDLSFNEKVESTARYGGKRIAEGATNLPGVYRDGAGVMWDGLTLLPRAGVNVIRGIYDYATEDEPE